MTAKPHNPYCDHNYGYGPNIRMDFGGEPFILRDHDGKEWLTEWHYYFGPSHLRKCDHEICDRQPGEKSRFWKLAQWWKEQGAKVDENGYGIWEEGEEQKVPSVNEALEFLELKRI